MLGTDSVRNGFLSKFERISLQSGWKWVLRKLSDMLNPIPKLKIALLLRKSSKTWNYFSSKMFGTDVRNRRSEQSRFKGAPLGIRSIDRSKTPVSSETVRPPVVRSLIGLWRDFAIGWKLKVCSEHLETASLYFLFRVFQNLPKLSQNVPEVPC